MQKKNFIFLIFVFAMSSVALAQTDSLQAKQTKNKQYNERGEIIKTGWNFGPLPVVGFDADLGFQYGLCCDIFNYGDGTRYPFYDFKMNVEASTYTKGSSVLRFYGDFPNLFKKTQMFVDMTYFNAKKYEFFGFNGYEKWQPDAISDAWNNIFRSQFRFLASFQKPIPQVKGLYWTYGVAFYNTHVDRVLLDEYINQTTLYDTLLSETLSPINADEKNGGSNAQLRLGMVYDSRDHNSDPTRGIYLEGTFTGSTDFNGLDYKHLTFTMLWRQFVPLFNDKLIFSYRLGAQNLLAGNIPWYMAQNLNTMFFRKMYTEGLGGNNTLRGIDRNRLVGDGFAFANFELRWRVLGFQFINQNWTVVLNPFFDMGMITQQFRSDRLDEYYANAVDIVRDKEQLHSSAGCGFKLIMNRNLIVNIELARALNIADGDKLKTYIGFNYIF